MTSSRIFMVASVLAILTANPLYAKESDSPADSAKSVHQVTTKITSAETNSLAAIGAIDKTEILLGVIATNKKPSSGVADLAKMMIDQHGSNLTQILEIVHNQNAKLEVGETAKKIHSQSMKELLDLGGLQGEQFEKAYVDAMVKGHEDALKLIDEKLMKTAKSEEIKKFLTDTRAAVAMHLEDAKKLQQQMKS